MKRIAVLLLATVAAASAMICPSCGAINPDDAEDCWNCGTLLADMYPCPYCGHLNSADALFCAGCFAELPQNPSIPSEVPIEPAVPAEPEEPVELVEPERAPVFYIGDYDVFIGGRLGPAFDLSAWPMSCSLSAGCDVGMEDYLSLDVTYRTLEDEYDSLSARIGLTTYRLSNPPFLFRLGTSLGYAKQRSLLYGDHEETLEYFDCALCLGPGLLLFPSYAAFLNPALELDLVVAGLFRRGEARLNLTLELGVAFFF